MEKIEAGQFLDFVKLFPIRRNKKQKQKIQENLIHYYNAFNIKPTEYVESLGLRKVRHFLFGDLEKAELIVACGYDTAERLILGTGDYWPLDENRNRSKNFVNITLQVVISLVMAVGGVFLIRYALTLKTIMKIVNIVCAVLIFYLANFFAQGLTNRATFSKSCSLFMNLEIIKHYNSKKVCYLYLDYGSYTKVGINFLKSEQFKGKKIVYLDFFGDGDTLLIGHDDKGIKVGKYIEENYDGDVYRTKLEGVNRFNELENITILANTSIAKDKTYVVKNVKTDDDLVVDENVMQRSFDALIKLCKGV